MSEPEEEGERTYPIEVPANILRRLADKELGYKLGELSANYEAIDKKIEHNEEEAQRQWNLLHQEIETLGEAIDRRLEKLEDAYKKVIIWMAGISAGITVAVWFVEHFVLKG